jgi:hypothetical protein
MEKMRLFLVANGRQEGREVSDKLINSSWRDQENKTKEPFCVGTNCPAHVSNS